MFMAPRLRPSIRVVMTIRQYVTKNMLRAHLLAILVSHYYELYYVA